MGRLAVGGAESAMKWSTKRQRVDAAKRQQSGVRESGVFTKRKEGWSAAKRPARAAAEPLAIDSRDVVVGFARLNEQENLEN